MRAGFAEVDITPPLGTPKIGNLRYHEGRNVADPLFARAAVFDDGTRALALISLDALSVSRRHVAEIRNRLSRDPGLVPGGVLVAATHTHGGGALIRCAAVAEDQGYRDQVTAGAVTAVCAAHAALEPATLASARVAEPHVARNRRVVYPRDGFVRTHGVLQDPEALWIEGPNDPEVWVLVARDNATGEPLGCLINYACHPTDHGGDDQFSAGFPGVVGARLAEAGVPISLYLNGAQGNVHPMDPSRDGWMPDMHEVGSRLADRVRAALDVAAPLGDLHLDADALIVRLPFRAADDDERRGAIPGAQRFAARGPEPDDWPQIYADMIDDLDREVAEEGEQVAEVQRLRLGPELVIGLPAEPFVELGLAIKEAAHPRRAVVVGLANGMVGYVPTRAAFQRGGYETTLSTSSKLAPEAGELLVEAGVRLATLSAI